MRNPEMLAWLAVVKHWGKQETSPDGGLLRREGLFLSLTHRLNTANGRRGGRRGGQGEKYELIMRWPCFAGQMSGVLSCRQPNSSTIGRGGFWKRWRWHRAALRSKVVRIPSSCNTAVPGFRVSVCFFCSRLRLFVSCTVLCTLQSVRYPTMPVMI